MGRILVQLGVVMALLVSSTPLWAQDSDSLSFKPRTGRAIQPDSSLPQKTRRGRCNPAMTRCQLPRHRLQPSDSDLNQRTESGSRLNEESSLNTHRRIGPLIDTPTPQ